MSFRIETNNRQVVVYLSGEIDHHASLSIRKDIDYAVRECDALFLILDFSDVTFMDSSGIGLVMGRYRLMRESGGQLVIRDPKPNIKKVMKLSGVDRLAQISCEKGE